MSSFSRDTTDEAAEVQRAVWRSMPPDKKFRLSLAWSSTIREITLAGIRERHPHYSDHQVNLAWAKLIMSPVLRKPECVTTSPNTSPAPHPCETPARQNCFRFTR